MESDTMKRSSWLSGSACVPAEPRGFWVAMQIKGAGRACVSPSTVIVCSSMTSSSADWVFGEVRLISSARSSWQFAAPSRYSNSPVLRFHMVKPVMSDGRVSGVNWMRRVERPSTRENATARVVLPTPGQSSSSTWPPA